MRITRLLTLLTTLAYILCCTSTTFADQPNTLASESDIYPIRLAIPSIGVLRIPVSKVGLDANRAMEAPSGWWEVGWFQEGTVPGRPGSSVIAGHYDSTTGPAVFWKLSTIKKGDKILILLSNGVVQTFVVEAKEVYAFDQAPLDRIFIGDGKARLNLITCSGSFDRRSANYNKRLVVYAVAAR